MAAGADSRAYKRLGKTLDLTGATAPQLNFKFSADLEAGLGLRGRRGARRHDDPNATRGRRCPRPTPTAPAPDASLTARRATGRRRCPEGLATGADAPHPFLLHYLVGGLRADGHDRRVERVHRLDRRLDGLDRRPVGVRRQEGRRLRSRVITDWGTLGLGAWVDDVRR